MNNTPKPAKEKWFINKLYDVVQSCTYRKLKIPRTAYDLLLALAKFADKKGYCWPLGSQLENACGVSTKNQARGFKILKEKKFITIKRKFDRRSSMTRNYYSIHLDAILTISMGLDGDLRVDGIAVRPVMTGAESECSDIEPPFKVKVDQPFTLKGAIYKTTHTTKLPIKNKTQSFTPETNTNKHLNPKSILYNVQNKALDVQNFINENEVITMENDLHFDDFWAAYPRKEKKKETRRIWVRDQLDEIADEIIQDVRLRQVRHAPWLEGRSFIPLPSSYLNGERWEDDLIDVRSSTGKFNSATHLVDEVRKNYENQNRNNSNIFDATNHFSKKVD